MLKLDLSIIYNDQDYSFHLAGGFGGNPYEIETEGIRDLSEAQLRADLIKKWIKAILICPTDKLNELK